MIKTIKYPHLYLSPEVTGEAKYVDLYDKILQKLLSIENTKYDPFDHGYQALAKDFDTYRMTSVASGKLIIENNLTKAVNKLNESKKRTGTET